MSSRVVPCPWGHRPPLPCTLTRPTCGQIHSRFPWFHLLPYRARLFYFHFVCRVRSSSTARVPRLNQSIQTRHRLCPSTWRQSFSIHCCRKHRFERKIHTRPSRHRRHPSWSRMRPRSIRMPPNFEIPNPTIPAAHRTSKRCTRHRLDRRRRHRST